MGCIDMNTWYSRIDKPERPDWVLFDLDPSPDVGFKETVQVALLVKQALDAFGLVGFPKTSSAEGMHILVPIERRYTYADTRQFAEIVAGAIARTHRGLATTEWTKAKRRGVLIDANQNGEGKTIASAYSVRPRPGAPVSTPLRWSEVNEDLDPLVVHDAGRARASPQARRPLCRRAHDEAAADRRAEGARRLDGRGCDLKRGGGRLHLFPPENALERSDAAFVERRAAFLSEQGERSLVAPRGSIDPRRDERVVDVADGEDAGVETDRARVSGRAGSPCRRGARGGCGRVLRRGVEAAELAQELDSPLGMPLDDGELVFLQRGRLLQDPARHGELADVVQKSADCERAQSPGREPELLADLHRAQCDTARVLLRRLVLLRETLHQCVYACAEERFLLRNELRGAKVADERS